MIQLFLSDFRMYVRNSNFNPEKNEFPVFYFESESLVYFYKIFGSFMFYTEVDKTSLPDAITMLDLKQEFRALEIPKKVREDIKFNVVLE